MVIAGFKHMVSFGMGRICRGKNKGSKFSSIDQYIYVYIYMCGSGWVFCSPMVRQKKHV